MNIKVLASGSSGNCYILSTGDSMIMIEAGIPWKKIQQKLNFKAHEIDFALISHAHGDHAAHLKDVIKAGIDCYMSLPTAEALGVASHHRAKIIKPMERFVIGSWAILPFPTEHDCPGSLGFLLANKSGEKLLYATDTFYLRFLFKGLTHIMVEANYSIDILRENVRAGSLDAGTKNRIVKSHFSLANVKEFLKANNLSLIQEIWLLHLSDGNSDAERFRREIQSLTGKPTYIY